MLSKCFTLFNSFQARLSRRIAFCIFASIVGIEAIILVPSYYQRKAELLLQLEQISGAMVNATVRLAKQGVSNSVLLEEVKSLTRDSVILGVAIYRPDGQLIGTFGEPPKITFSELKTADIIPTRRWSGNRYDVAWSARQLGAEYILIARHDASSIQGQLYAYIGRIAGLVLLISVFVTSVTMVTLGAIVIVPVLRLRDDLTMLGEALGKEQAELNFYSLSVKRRDELGEVMKAFEQMFQRITWEISERKKTEEILRSEQEKSDRLLLNILPPMIAQQLKEGHSNIADDFAEVTILFADIVNFTQLAERVSPTELVKLLNTIFSAFDQLSEKHGLEKIKTIGDAYMVVGGLPMPRSDHAQAIAEMALEMQQAMAQFNAEQGEAFKIRIGINTGPVVAGVIGTKKFIYDLWGDAVNTASRMESQGIAGAIQVTTTTYELLQDKYVFKKRGVIQVKGKGEMTTYLLTSRKGS